MISHDYYKRFKSSYYYGSNDEPMINYSNFMTYTLLCVIDCSKQNTSLTIDVRLEIETLTDIADKTKIYWFIIYDSIMQYTPLFSVVRNR